MCNTVSYALAEATETGSLPFYHYYSYPVLAVVLLVQIVGPLFYWRCPFSRLR